MEEYSEYKEQTVIDKLSSIYGKSPMVPIGVVAFVGIVGHGIYKFRSRKIRPSLFLINYRLAAQGTFLGCVTTALAYAVFNRIVQRTTKHKEEQEKNS